MVPIDRTPKAELVRRRRSTSYSRHNGRQRRLGGRRRARDGVCAGGIWAVLEVRVGRYEMTYNEFVEAVPGFCVFVQDTLDERVGRDE